MNLIKCLNKCLNRLHLPQNQYKWRSLDSCRGFSSETSDTNDSYSDLIDEEAIINERTFAQLNAKHFASLADNDSQLNEIESILSHYEYQKYSTLEVPTTLTNSQMKQLLEMDNWHKRNKYLKQLYNREVKCMVKERAKDVMKNMTQQRLHDKYTQWNTGRSGIFNEEGDIIYGIEEIFWSQLRAKLYWFDRAVAQLALHSDILSMCQTIDRQ